MGQVLVLADALIHDRLPDGVTREQAKRQLAELKVGLYERMVDERPDDTDVALQLMEARENLSALTQDVEQP